MREYWLAIKHKKDDPWPREELCSSKESAIEYFYSHLRKGDRVEVFKLIEVEGTKFEFDRDEE